MGVPCASRGRREPALALTKAGRRCRGAGCGGEALPDRLCERRTLKLGKQRSLEGLFSPRAPLSGGAGPRGGRGCIEPATERTLRPAVGMLPRGRAGAQARLCLLRRAFEDEKKARMGVVECAKHELLQPFNVLYEKEGERRGLAEPALRPSGLLLRESRCPSASGPALETCQSLGCLGSDVPGGRGGRRPRRRPRLAPLAWPGLAGVG